MLYFVSDMPGGYGGLDIYKCTKLADGRWSSPINLGDRVNTSEHESYPFMLGNYFIPQQFSIEVILVICIALILSIRLIKRGRDARFQ